MADGNGNAMSHSGQQLLDPSYLHSSTSSHLQLQQLNQNFQPSTSLLNEQNTANLSPASRRQLSNLQKQKLKQQQVLEHVAIGLNRAKEMLQKQNSTRPQITSNDVQNILMKNYNALEAWKVLCKQEPSVADTRPYSVWLSKCQVLREQIRSRLELLASLADKQVAVKAERQLQIDHSVTNNTVSKVHYPISSTSSSIVTTLDQSGLYSNAPSNMFNPTPTPMPMANLNLNPYDINGAASMNMTGVTYGTENLRTTSYGLPTDSSSYYPTPLTTSATSNSNVMAFGDMTIVGLTESNTQNYFMPMPTQDQVPNLMQQQIYQNSNIPNELNYNGLPNTTNSSQLMMSNDFMGYNIMGLQNMHGLNGSAGLDAGFNGNPTNGLDINNYQFNRNNPNDNSVNNSLYMYLQ